MRSLPVAFGLIGSLMSSASQRCRLMTRTFKTWLMGLVATAAFVTVSFQWFDRPIALLIYEIFGGRRVPTELIQSADRIFSIPLITVVVSLYVISSPSWGDAFQSLR